HVAQDTGDSDAKPARIEVALRLGDARSSSADRNCRASASGWVRVDDLRLAVITGDCKPHHKNPYSNPAFPRYWVGPSTFTNSAAPSHTCAARIVHLSQSASSSSFNTVFQFRAVLGTPMPLSKF